MILLSAERPGWYRGFCTLKPTAKHLIVVVRFLQVHNNFTYDTQRELLADNFVIKRYACSGNTLKIHTHYSSHDCMIFIYRYILCSNGHG